MNYSIYIPTIYKSVPISDIREFMDSHIGSVSRIDSVDINQHNRRVFIHFTEWHDTNYTELIKYHFKQKGSSLVALPNIKNKSNPIFHATILINKNPLSHAEYKIKQLHKTMGNWVETIGKQQTKIDVLESKLLLFEDALNKLYGSYYGINMEDDMGPMNINELDC
jgi:hypothetical protein